MQSDYRESGFSLIELLVSVAIVTILAAIAVPEYKQYKSRAYNSVAQQFLKNLVVATVTGHIDYKADGSYSIRRTPSSANYFINCSNPSDQCNAETLLPGLTYLPNTSMNLEVSSKIDAATAHCKGDRNMVYSESNVGLVGNEQFYSSGFICSAGSFFCALPADRYYGVTSKPNCSS